MSTPPIIAPKKLIEVALPLDAINRACGREKSIRHGHPSTLHLWWARRPLAAARAVLFAQLVNDPSWKYSDDELKKNQIRGAITKKRNELFKLITELVQWENTTNEEVLERARREIRASWKETCEANRNHPEATTLFIPSKLPAFHDPFAGGGAIPLEAQRLGLDSHASDLNPVAVLINKAMIEIPPKFAGMQPVGPIPKDEKQTKASAVEDWSGAKGLAEDVRRYGAWIRDEAEKRIGHLYPSLMVTHEIVGAQPELSKYLDRSLTVMAWLWARTVASPSPAMQGAHVPLATTWLISTKKGREIWLEPVVKDTSYKLVVRTRVSGDSVPAKAAQGSKSGRGANFLCLLSGSPITGEYIKSEAVAGRMGQKLLALVCDADRERVYVAADEAQEVVAKSPKPEWRPNLEYAKNSRHMTPHAYGLSNFGDLFTNRQIVAMGTMATLIEDVRNKVADDARRAKHDEDRRGLEGGGTGATAYGDAIALYAAFALSKLADRGCTLCTWFSDRDSTRPTFARPALSMTWDFAETNVLLDGSGSFNGAIQWTKESLERVAARGDARGEGVQADARTAHLHSRVVSTDPPYYDNVPYADVSDFFYVWLRRTLRPAFPALFATLAVPKEEELVADPFRHGSKADAEAFFLSGMTSALKNIAEHSLSAFPVTIYYAFKQSETDAASGTSSAGWETFLEACLEAGFTLSGTWPVRTELSNRMRGSESNALASSIVLVVRRRGVAAQSVSRREFLREIDRALAPALVEMTADPAASVAPVDLAQAAIGPGMAIFSKYKSVLEADGEAMSVHNALIHINKAIDNFFSETEGDLDADTRFCIDWFQQRGFEPGPFGEADVLARAKGTAVDGVEELGVLSATKGKVRLLRVKEYPKKWDPAADRRVAIWEACHHLCRALGESEHEAGTLLARMPEKQDGIRQLAYRLYTICERQKWAEEARLYNELITSWPAIIEQSHRVGLKGTQLELL